MKLDITADEVARFERDGFLVLADALDAQELETWRREVGDAVFAGCNDEVRHPSAS